MASLEPAHLRGHLRSLLDRLGGGATFRDDEDVFASGVVRSIHLLELVVGVEDSYGITIDEADVAAGHLRSVDRLAALVAARARTVS